MFDIGGTELLLIGVVALIVVGPKDLPGMFRTVGQFVGKARRMAREFSSAMEAAADEAGVKDVTETFKAAANPAKFGMDKVKEAASDLGPATSALSEERQVKVAKVKAQAEEATARRKAKEETLAEGAEAPNAPLPEGAEAGDMTVPELEPTPVQAEEMPKVKEGS
ncbi:Sec-independent protein translocase protein TatB [Aestuariibius insulae]|uniref:Sec-independent protein translocase protein TatB n=1 Tax=Aestuariibius insulae TaxID=2058287 RepID=UPI00345F0AE4